jgi:hypothetical protein
MRCTNSHDHAITMRSAYTGNHVLGKMSAMSSRCFCVAASVDAALRSTASIFELRDGESALTDAAPFLASVASVQRMCWKYSSIARAISHDRNRQSGWVRDRMVPKDLGTTNAWYVCCSARTIVAGEDTTTHGYETEVRNWATEGGNSVMMFRQILRLFSIDTVVVAASQRLGSTAAPLVDEERMVASRSSLLHSKSDSDTW